ncbi:hypothetical protein [Terrihalobacillus insolitus]|uniref:hypothetical protein n=1 Tax=Terrihalobacillus insolitus TaxID=2950438 RepID=UPI002341BF6C|nr:hypothetical protein [Terrihalobacillus insolitus]MDC3413933.1 hypothetical protein [Terrihalobacillus insolitus]
MANPTLLINPYSQVRFPIWENADYNDPNNDQLGEIYYKELWTSINSCYYGCDTPDWAFSAARGWTKCYVPTGEWGADLAYGEKYAQWSINSSRHVFYVRRKCRVFKGTTEMFSLYAGDAICTDGKSVAGLTHPDRLNINGWRRNGVWTQTTSDYWCDTDINIGYSMYNEATVYGKW